MKHIFTIFIIHFLFLSAPIILSAAEADINGFLSHSIDLQLPPGTMGMSPKLALTYSSEGPNGIIGKGWSLSGLPYITRDTTSEITYTESDSYVGTNGGRLMRQADGTYHYENENYSRIQACGSRYSDKSPEYWIETLKDGTKYYYGKYDSDSDSANVATSHINSFIRVWALSKVEDVHGNYYTVEYMQDRGEYYPKRIVYTQGNGISSYRIIDFDYEHRTDYSDKYTYATTVATRYRLSSIEVSIDRCMPGGFLIPSWLIGDTVYTYELDYKYDNSSGSRESLLSSYAKYSSRGRLVDSQSFSWDSAEGGYSWSSLLYAPDEDDKVITGDFDGDGYTDICYSDYESDVMHVGYATSYKTFIWYNFTRSLKSNISGSEIPFTGDFNGDGKTDIAYSDSNDSKDCLWIGYSTGRSFSWKQIERKTSDSIDDEDSVFSIDINGDGLSDIFYSDFDDNRIVIGISTENSFKWYFIERTPDTDIRQDEQVTAGDFNGDGKSDICYACPEKDLIYIGLSTGSGFDWSSDTRLGLRKEEQLFSGDFNGDGRTDIAFGDSSESENCIHVGFSYSFGNGFWFESVSRPSMYADIDHNDYAYAIDADGDGYDDILYSDYNDDRFFTGLFYRYTTSDSTTYDFTWDCVSKDVDQDDRIITGDFNGDGICDIGYSNHEDGIIDIQYYSGNPAGARINEISLYSGVTISVTYTNATRVPGAIVSTSSNYPYTSNTSPRMLVTSIRQHDDAGNEFGSDYSYYDAKIYMGAPSEKQNLGFKTITVTDVATGSKTVTDYYQEEWYAGKPEVVTTYIRGSLFQDVVQKVDSYSYSSDSSTFFAGTHAVNVLSINSASYESGIPVYTKSKRYTYDIMGNPLKIVDSSTGTPDVVTDITYNSDSDSWIFGRPYSVKKYSGPLVVEKKIYEYHDDNLISITSGFESGKTRVEKFSYDECGNIISVTDAMGNVTSIEYDGNYRAFPISITNALGQKVETEYEPVFGKAVYKTDAAGNTTETQYDERGREIAVYDANGDLKKEIDYDDSHTGSLLRCIKTINYIDVYGSCVITKSYVDPFNREYRKWTSAGEINGESIWRVEETEYNSAGQIIRKSLPYIMGKQVSLYRKFSYDYLGRVVRETRPISETENVTYATAYSGSSGIFTVTQTDPSGSVTVSDYDSRNRLIAKREGGLASISYQYDAADRLISVIDADNNITSINYDSLGQRTSITEPNSGITYFTYDACGRMTGKLDANDRIVNYSYDAIGRKTAIDYDDEDATSDVTFTYDEASASNGIGRLTAVEEANCITKYSYDENGNTVYTRKRVDSTNYVFMMEYNLAGKMTSIIFPDNTRIERNYAEPGYLQSVTNAEDGGAYIQYGLNPSGSSAVNSVFRITGDSTETIIDYNPATMQPVNLASYNSKGETLENNSYTYDKAGNITAINDSLKAVSDISQSFKYDSLKRLVYARGIYGEENYSYSPGGNLTHNSHGTLMYDDPAHPNAVTFDGHGNHYSYDYAGNMVKGRDNEYLYDTNNRLISVLKSGGIVQKNFYDYTGHRIKQVRQDGTTIYNINGIYQVVKAKARIDQHTKFIYGMEGDIAAQVTTTAPTLIAACDKNGWSYDNGYGGSGLIKYFARGLIGLENFTGSVKNIRYINIALILFLALALAGSIVVTGVKRRFKGLRPAGYSYSKKAVSSVMVTALFSMIFLTACDDKVEARNDQPAVEDNVDSTTGGDAAGDDTTPECGTTGQTPLPNYDESGLPTTGTYYFHPDHLGSIACLTDSAGKIVTRMNYTPYGETTGTVEASKNIFSQKFTGQADDGVKTGLLYYKARFYDPVVGRFLSADSIVPGVVNTQAFNRYSYVNNNPLMFIDRNGHWSVKGVTTKIVSAVGGSIAGAAAGAYVGALAGAQYGPEGVVAGAITGAVVGGVAGGAVGATMGFNNAFGMSWYMVQYSTTGYITGNSVGAVTGAINGACIGASLGFSEISRRGLGSFFAGPIYNKGYDEDSGKWNKDAFCEHNLIHTLLGLSLSAGLVACGVGFDGFSFMENVSLFSFVIGLTMEVDQITGASHKAMMALHIGGDDGKITYWGLTDLFGFEPIEGLTGDDSSSSTKPPEERKHAWFDRFRDISTWSFF